MDRAAIPWKEVSDELPPDGEVVLVATAEGLVRTAAYTYDSGWVGGDGSRAHDVCFWQPLPEVPAAVAKVDLAYPHLFLVEEWEAHEGSEVSQILLDEGEARQIWAKDQKAGRQGKGLSTRSHGIQVRRWIYLGGKYQLDPDWPPVGRRTT